MKEIIGIKMKFILSLGLIFVTYSCLQTPNNNVVNDTFEKNIENSVNCATSNVMCDTINLKNLISLLGKNIDSLPDINEYKKVKTTLEDEEGYMEWYGVEYFDENDLILMAESNWMNKNIVDRITLYSKQVKEDKLFISQSMGCIRDLLENQIPTSPDGELFVKSKKYPEISIQLDISNIPSTSPLYYGITDISEIPDSLKVETIIIMKQ